SSVNSGIASLLARPILPRDRAAAWRTLASGSSNASIRSGTASAALEPCSPSALAAWKRFPVLGLFKSLMRLAIGSLHPDNRTARTESRNAVLRMEFMGVAPYQHAGTAYRWERAS